METPPLNRPLNHPRTTLEPAFEPPLKQRKQILLLRYCYDTATILLLLVLLMLLMLLLLLLLSATNPVALHIMGKRTREIGAEKMIYGLVGSKSAGSPSRGP